MLHNIPPSCPFTVTLLIAAAMQRADSNREVISIPHNKLTNDLFIHLWARDVPYPIVVTPIPRWKLLQYPWTPDFFTGITGRTECEAQDCETGDIVPTMVGDFYNLFGKECDNRQILRLKVLCHFMISPFAFGLAIHSLQDYPSSKLFQTSPLYSYLHPDLMNATPMSNYTRQDGCFNVALYFPRGDAKSDLSKLFQAGTVSMYKLWQTYVGPKMYLALRDKKGIGSTRLHLDIAPTFNELVYVHSQGRATWKLFARKDADRLCIYLFMPQNLSGISHQCVMSSKY